MQRRVNGLARQLQVVSQLRRTPRPGISPGYHVRDCPYAVSTAAVWAFTSGSSSRMCHCVAASAGWLQRRQLTRSGMTVSPVPGNQVPSALPERPPQASGKSSLLGSATSWCRCDCWSAHLTYVAGRRRLLSNRRRVGGFSGTGARAGSGTWRVAGWVLVRSGCWFGLCGTGFGIRRTWVVVVVVGLMLGMYAWRWFGLAGLA